MAARKALIRNSKNLLIYKFSGNSDSSDIAVPAEVDVDFNSSEVLTSTEERDPGTDFLVNIVGFHVITMNSGTIAVERDFINILEFPSGVIDSLDMGTIGFSDTEKAGFNIKVKMYGTGGYLYLILRKNSGFRDKNEIARFSIYDDKTKFGS